MLHLTWHPQGHARKGEWSVWDDVPIEACYVGPYAGQKLVDFARHRCGSSAFVVADAATEAAAGDAFFAGLRDAGMQVDTHIFDAADLEATQERADAVAVAGQDADCYIAIGGGTLCDLAKSAGTAQQKPVLLYATAASMNGYTSGIVALKVRGLKRTIPCNPATGIFADPEVCATAPQRMTAAGVADFLSKCSSAADWQAAHLLRGEPYSARPREIVGDIQDELFARADKIGRGDPESIDLVLQALMLSGFGMVIAGSSAPASGGEHLLSHYIDMKHSLYGTANDLHGTQVGLGTLYTLELWQRVLALSPDDVDPEAMADQVPSDDAIREAVFADWGEHVGPEVWAQWQQKTLDRAGLLAELMRFSDKLDVMRAALSADLQTPERVAACIETCGGPIRAEDSYVPVDEFEKAKANARYLRNRFTVLDIAAELGIA